MYRKYQLNYAAGNPRIYNKISREQKASRMIKILKLFFGRKELKKLTVLDVGCSNGIIGNSLAKNFKKVIGIDIDRKAIQFAQKNFRNKNLEFKIGDAMNLRFKDNNFDIVICAHVYEHVPDSQRLFEEIHRVLRPKGICYLAVANRLWPLEEHYNLPFLSWLPKTLANRYIQLTNKADKYYENHKTYWGLKKLTKKFKRMEYTQKILRNPKKFGYGDMLKPPLSYLVWFLSPFARYLSPTFFWLLEK